jgi:hypothetical protein
VRIDTLSNFQKMTWIVTHKRSTLGRHEQQQQGAEAATCQQA